MPLTDEQLRQGAQQYFVNKGIDVNAQQQDADYGKPPPSFDDQINQMPNADKLTRSERAIYGALPGVAKSNAVKGISWLMEDFGQGIIGKGLGLLDVGAEGLERTVGLASQMLSDPDFDTKELKAAWYAGSLTGDMTNLPQFVHGNKVRVPTNTPPHFFKWVDAAPGQQGDDIVGMRIPSDLPGSGGLNDARAKIQKYMDGGMSAKDALAKTRDEYYNGLGALALRSQINDMWFHVVGDPLNVLTAYFKPIEALKARSIVALTTKVEDVGEFAKAADRSFELIKTAANAEDALKYADEAAELAKIAGDTKKAAKYSEEAANLAKGLGRTEDVARHTEQAGKFASMTAEDAAKFSDDALKALGKKKITTADKIAIMLSGGDPFRPSELGQKLSKIPILKNIAGAFKLTPESKARELMHIISDNLGKTIGQMMNNPNAEAEFVAYMRRVSKGATGIEYGHGFLTLEGRTVQSFVSGGGYDLEKMFSQYEMLAPSRAKLELLTKTLGESPEKLFGMLKDNPDNVLKMLAKYAPNNPALAQMLQTGELDRNALARLVDLKNVPYNKEMFFAKSLDAIETASMRQAVVQFGVQSKGALTRWSDAVKAAESLAFLRLNPAYPFRNKINNDITMIARGLFGVADENAINDFWKGFGQIPTRLSEDLNPAHEVAESLSQADKILKEAITGGNYGTPEKVKEFFKKMELGKLDFAKNWGQMFEKQAGRKAFTLGTQQYLRRLYKPKLAREYLNPKVLDNLAEISPEFEKTLDNAIKSAGAMDGKLDEILGTNLNLSVDNVLEEVNKTIGGDARQLLGDEVLNHLHAKLPEAIANGSTDQFVQETRQLINKHIDDLFNKQLENVVEHVKAQTAAGGPNVWNRTLAKAQDIFWGAHIEHSIRMPEATRLAREASLAGDFDVARALWKQEAEDSRLFYDRAFKRVDAYIQGLEEGTTHLAQRGAKIPFADTRRTFNEWKGLWEDFFQKSTKMKDEFWDTVKAAKGTGKQPVWDDVQTQINDMYKNVIEREDALGQKLDDTIGGMIDDPQAKTAFTNARDQLAKLRKEDKELMMSMRETVNDLPKEARQDEWNRFWQERQVRYQNMRQVDAESIIIQQKDAATIAKYTPQGEIGKPGEFNIFQLANEFGISSATESGARNDRRILSTVNKYAKQTAEDVSSVPLSQVTDVARSQLPPDVSNRFADEAKRLLNELSGGTVEKSEIGARLGSTNVPWYKELNQGKGLQKPEIEKALEKIIEDHGKDKGINVQRLKEMILDNFTHGDDVSGTPPDLNVLQQLGAPDSTMQSALDNFNDITKGDYTLEEAIKLSGGSQKIKRYTKVSDIPEDVARAAFEAQATAKGAKTAAQGVQPAFIADVNKVIPDPQPVDLSLDMMAYGRQYSALDEIAKAAKTQAKKPPAFIKDLPEELQNEVMRSVKNIKNDFASTRYSAMKFGEWRRDSALLNYSRRTNFDTMLGNIAPFSFWTTHSLATWAVESIDRPAMLTNYMRMREFLATAGLQRDGMATRSKGKIRIDIPFAPDWMGEQFIDPLRVALPFDNWISPFEQWEKSQSAASGRTQRVLDQLYKDGKITDKDYQNARDKQSGAAWDYAEGLAKQNDDSDTYDAWDFATTMAAPHAPIMWAYNAAFGDKKDIGPFSPISRIARNAATLMGVEDWNNSKYNLEAKVRKQLGLPAYDKFDNYRIKRAASDLAGEGTLTAQEAMEVITMESMIETGKMTPEQAKQQSEAYKLAVKRSNQEYTGGPGAVLLGLVGLSVTSIPQGENDIRALQDDFGNAYGKYKAADDSLDDFLAKHPMMDAQEAADLWKEQNPKLAKDADALTDFLNKNPEYETRLSLFDKPENQIHNFMIDQVWKRFNELPKVNQDEARDQLGADFQDAFLNKDTRSYDSIDSGTLQVWLKLMGTDPLGGLSADQRMLVNLYGKVQFTEPETAQRVQVFYDDRKQQFPNYGKLQNDYYKLPKGSERKKFLAKNPELKQYFDWRSSFFNDNPDILSYLTDDEKAIERAKNKTRTTRAVPTAAELQQVAQSLPPSAQMLLADSMQSGEPIPPILVDYLSELAQAQGLTVNQFIKILGTQYAQPQQ